MRVVFKRLLISSIRRIIAALRGPAPVVRVVFTAVLVKGIYLAMDVGLAVVFTRIQRQDFVSAVNIVCTPISCDEQFNEMNFTDSDGRRMTGSSANGQEELLRLKSTSKM